MTDLALMKRDTLRFVQDARTVRGMGRDLSVHPVVLCNARLIRARIKRREVVDGTSRSEKMREHQYREG